MKKRKAISLLLSLSVLCAVAAPKTMTFAQTGDAVADNGMSIDKTAKANEDGSYTITLEAYATGDKVISQEKKDIPVDIVLVLDQSGSMTDNMGEYKFRTYYQQTNAQFFEKRHNGGADNLYYSLGNNKYAPVSVEKSGNPKYTVLPPYNVSDSQLYENNNLYFRKGNEYLKVTVSRQANTNMWGVTTYNYSYTIPDGTEIATGGYRGPAMNSGYDRNDLYTLDDSTMTYTYSYTDADGESREIGSHTGNSTPGSLYEYYLDTAAGGTRIAALKAALKNFVGTVEEKVKGTDEKLNTDDDIDHRIAVVGFGCGKDTHNYQWTELLSLASAVRYSDNIRNDQYQKALQSMKTAEGRNIVNGAVNLNDRPGGQTRADLGMKMAENILDQNQVPEATERFQVVIMFTDGVPTDNHNNQFTDSVMNDAIAYANHMKDAGATVYTVGVFSGADATKPGNQNGSEIEKTNWYMHQMSSDTYDKSGYYLSAADAASLNNIFQQIADNIESGGSATTLNAETVIRDVISDSFALPEGTSAENITLETYKCIGKDGEKFKWASDNDGPMGASATVAGDKVSVTGFDFAQNYVGTVNDNGTVTYRGHKLVISFKVKPKEGFIGGNDVPTNAGAGVYENDTAEKPVLTFPEPVVNVPIPAINVSVGVGDKNVYLLGDLTAEQIKEGAEASLGDVKLALQEENFGLEDWQNKFVDITVVYKDNDGNEVINLTDLKEDTVYRVEVAVTPEKTVPSTKEGEVAVKKSDMAEGKINVFKPEVTCRDSEVYYGDILPDKLSDNLTETRWMHNETQAATVTMIGNAPALDITCTPDAAKVKDGKINTKQDVEVDATVRIDDTDVTADTTFVHTACSPECSWNETTPDGSPAFLCHVRTCRLQIEKKGGASDEPYVFTVYKDGEKYSEVTIFVNNTQTICELPVGKYTIGEDTGWSWRYSADNGENVELTAKKPEGSITCTNTKDKEYWLNGFSNVRKNIFGSAK